MLALLLICFVRLVVDVTVTVVVGWVVSLCCDVYVVVGTVFLLRVALGRGLHCYRTMFCPQEERLVEFSPYHVLRLYSRTLPPSRSLHESPPLPLPIPPLPLSHSPSLLYNPAVVDIGGAGRRCGANSRGALAGGIELERRAVRGR